MPEMQSAQRLDCAHCEKTGTCQSKDGGSCAKCIKMARLSAPGETEKGLICSVCGGVGTAEPKTLRFLNMFLPIFSAVFVGLLLIWMLVLAVWVQDKSIFHDFVVFAGTAIGSVTGYYFGGTKRQSSS